jgi:molybdopterin synthase sulfur carrier subunit
MTTAAAPGADAPPQVTVRYWAGARAAAGVDTEVLSGATVADVLARARAAHAGLAPVLQVATVLLDGRPTTPAVRLTEGAMLEVLPPFAGG